MRTKFKNAARLIVVFMILITSTKCQKDDDLGQANDKTLLSAKQWFKNYETEGNNYALFQNLNYNWSDAEITNSEDGTKTIIVPIDEVKKDSTENWEQKLYIYKLAENYYEASLIEIYPDKNNTDPNSSLIENGIFTGYISVGDIKKGFLKVAKFENGKLVENGIINLRSKSKTAKAPSNQVPCPVGTDCDTDIPGGGTPLKEVVVNNNYKDPSGYIITYNYGGGGYTGGITPGGYTNHGTGASGITAPTPAEIANALEKQINSDKLNPCQKEVLEMLKNATNADIARMFIKLGVSTNYTVTFYSETTIDGTPAATQRVSQYNYKIQLSTDYTGSTKLFRAGNILHELGHAYFMSIKDDYSSTTPPNAAVFNNYSTLFQGYVEKKYPNMYDAHHIEMANQYIDVIALTLQEYNKSADPNGAIPYQVYTDLAWGGLKGTPIFEEKFKVGTTERLRIDNRYAAEQTGNSVGHSTGELQNTVGKPCN